MRTRNGRRAGDQHVVVPGRRVHGQDIPRDGPQPPAGAVPLDRAADPAAGRQPVTNRTTRRRMAASLQHESRCHGFFSLRGNPKKFRPPLERADGRWHRATPRGACGPFFVSGPILYVRPLSPSGRETRGGVCARGGLAGRYVSRCVSTAQEREARCIEARLGQVNWKDRPESVEKSRPQGLTIR